MSVSLARRMHLPMILFAAFALALLLTGCATPKPIRKVAEQGAATVQLAEISLREYVDVSNAQLAARMDLVRAESQRLATDKARRELDRFLDQSAGLPADDATERLIRQLGDQSRQIRDKAAQEQEKIAKATTLDAAAFATVPAEKLNAAKKTFSVLAAELTPEEWINLAAGYVKEISTGIQQFKDAEEKEKQKDKP